MNKIKNTWKISLSLFVSISMLFAVGCSDDNDEAEPDHGDWLTDTDTEVVEVINPETGKTWMDRNLGAGRTANSSSDAQAFGHLYQWGRAADGHQERSSGTTTTLSDSDESGHGNFIIVPDGDYMSEDWRDPQNNDLWQGVNGINNPCPHGYRLPTKAELEAERQSWGSLDAAGAFDSPLKWPAAGYRNFINGTIYDAGSDGLYWSSTAAGQISWIQIFDSGVAEEFGFLRANGASVRCIKD